MQMRLPDIPFADDCAVVQQRIERIYGIKVVTRDIPDPLTGDLDGLEIHIDHAITAEQRLFLLAHLFGHTVQWNLDPGAFDVGKQYCPPVAEDLIPRIIEYESEAARYGLALCNDARIDGIESWFSAYSACDQAYLLHFYRTGEKKDFHSFWADNVLIVQPKPIPPFTPQRRTFRMDGVVI
jgi:hypothetical protein